MSSRLVQTHLGESKSCCQSVQTIPALHVSSLDTITPVSWIVEDFFFFFSFLLFSLQGGGAVFCLGPIVFRGGQWAVLPQTVMTQLSRPRASPQNTVFKGCKRVLLHRRLHTFGRDECERGCDACGESGKRHFRSNDCVSALPPPLQWWLLSKNKPRSVSRRGKSDQGQGCENTGLLLQNVPAGLLSFDGGTWHCRSNEML